MVGENDDRSLCGFVSDNEFPVRVFGIFSRTSTAKLLRVLVGSLDPRLHHLQWTGYMAGQSHLEVNILLFIK